MPEILPLGLPSSARPGELQGCEATTVPHLQMVTQRHRGSGCPGGAQPEGWSRPVSRGRLTLGRIALSQWGHPAGAEDAAAQV